MQISPRYLKGILEQLLEALVSYTDPNGRLISDLFQKLPSKLVGFWYVICIKSHQPCIDFIRICFLVFQQYPDYYAVIKEPIDLRTIAQRIQVWLLLLLITIYS